MKKKTKIIVTIVIIVLLLLVLALLYFIFGMNKTYTIKFNTDGGTNIEEIEVKPGETLKLPESPKKEGYIFAGWANEEGEIITSDIKLEKDITLSSLWIEEGKEISTISFDTDSGSSYNDIIIEKGKILVLPVEPTKEGYIFVGWINQDGNIITNDYVINNDIKLYAKWVSKVAKTVTLKFNTDGGNKINNIVVENGKIVYFPVTPTKTGYVFNGWVNEKGEEVNADTTFTGNITLKATWKELYTCPGNCEVSSDGKTCTKTETTNMTTTSGCSSGTETVEHFCSKAKGDGFSAPRIECEGAKTGYCVNPNVNGYELYDYMTNSCPSGYLAYSYAEHGGAMIGCLKKINKVSSNGCPSGYTQSGDKCTKTEIINCTLNVAKEYKNEL